MKFLKSNNKAPLFSTMHVALLLLCAVLLSAYAIGGLYARYASGQSGDDDARVAKFSFSDNLDAQSIALPVTMAPGESQKVTIQVQNTGEVALKYVVKVENLTGNLPIKTQTIASDVLLSGSDLTEFSWEITWSATENSIEKMGKMDIIRITVTVEQFD